MKNIGIKLLAVGAGAEQLPFIQKAKDMGYYVITCDMNPVAEGAKYADVFYNVDIKDVESVLGIAANEKIQGIIPAPIGRNLNTIGLINDALNLLGPSFFSCSVCTNKAIFNHLLANNGIKSTNFLYYKKFENKRPDLNTLRFPIVVKPINGSGSKGVILIKDALSFENFMETNKQNEYYKEGILIEEYQYGRSFGIDFLVKNGKISFLFLREKEMGKLPYLVEYGYYGPALLSEENQKKIHDTLQDCVSVIKLENGCGHADIILTERNEVFIVELAPRPSGLLLSSYMVEAATGVDFAAECIKIITSGKQEWFKPTPKKSISFYAIRFITPKEGVLIKKPNHKKEQTPNIVDVCTPLKVGDQITLPKNIADLIRNGYFIAKSDSLAHLKIVTDNFNNLFETHE
jgi:biotin carboxylase